MIVEYHHHPLKKRNIDALSKFLKILEDNSFGYHLGIIARAPYEKMQGELIMIYAYQK